MRLLALVIASLALLLLTWSVVRRLRLRGLVEQLCAALLVFASAVVVVSLVVGGLFRGYQPVPLMLACVALTVGLLALMVRFAPSRIRSPLRDLRAYVAIAAETRVPWRPRMPVVVLASAVGIMALLVSAQYVWRALIALRLPALDWDGLQYHLVAPDVWIQAGRITHSPQSIWADAYPLNVELLMAWPGVFLHTMRYAPLAQLPLYLLGALAVTGIARRVGASRLPSVFAALIYLAIPAVFAQASTTYIDVSGTAFALASVYFVTGLVPACRAGAPVSRSIAVYGALSGIALGLAVGAKAPNLLLLPIVALALAVSMGRLRKISPPGETPAPNGRIAAWFHGFDHRRGVLACAMLGLPVALLGSFWYLRTFITYGNPIYPFNLGSLPGRGSVEDVILRGNTPVEILTAPAGPLLRSWWEDFHPHLTQYDTRLGGLGMAWVVAVIPLAIAAIVLYVRRRGGPLPVVAAAGLVTLVASPAPWWARYVLLTAATACALAGFTLTRLMRSPRRAAGYLAIVATAAILSLSAVSMWWATNPSFICPVDTCRTQGLLSAGGTWDLMWQPHRHQRVWPWPGYAALGRIPDGSTIAVPRDPGQAFTHPIIGERLQRRVVPIENPRTPDELATVLRQNKARYVLLDPNRATRTLALAVSKDLRFALRTGANERVDGHDLFEFGTNIGGCAKPNGSLKLVKTSPTTGAALMTFVLNDGCARPRAGALVELYSADHTKRLWRGDVRDSAAYTDARGQVTFRVAAPPRFWRYFARSTGDTYDRPEVSPNVVLDRAARLAPVRTATPTDGD